VYKWLSGATTDLYHVMIYMFLAPGTVDDSGRLFSGQAGLQVRVTVCVRVCVS
jgi:V-type H+-transporting ATPase subunit a